MADRFVFIPLPYLLAGAALCALKSETVTSALHGDKTRLQFGTALVALICVFVSARNVPLWRAELPLFKNCVDRAGSDRCWWHYARELLKTGCPLVGHEWGRLTTQLKERSKDPHALFPPDGAIALSFCEAVSSNQPIKVRESTIDKLQRDGGSPEALSFARNILSVERGQPREALLRIVELFMSKTLRTSELSTSVLGVIQGQLQALCEIGADPSCVDVSRTFRARFGENQLVAKTVQFGYDATRRAWLARESSAQTQN